MAQVEGEPSNCMSVLHELSSVNGRLNRMRKPELIQLLHKLKLDMSGKEDVLRRRLKNHFKRLAFPATAANFSDSSKQFDYLCIVDFEATCEESNCPDYVHEIIEFPAVLLCMRSERVVHEFHRYCRPSKKCTLSEFCTSLTGITQAQVDASDPFPVVLAQFEEWLEHHRLGTEFSFAFVTDCFSDLGNFVPQECSSSSIPIPKYFQKWINIRKIFSNFYNCRRLRLKDMLEVLGLSFEGREHCGLDDARNIARIVLKLLSDGAELKINERIYSNRPFAVDQARSQNDTHHSKRHRTSNEKAARRVDPDLTESLDTLALQKISRHSRH